MLYFGSFNPIHKGHIALAEHVIREGLCDEVALIVSPRNPLKSSAELAPEIDRYEMAEVACGESEYPTQIKPSVIEFLLERPSYTINTLRHLSENFGEGCEFMMLMGSDILPQFDRWRCYEEILENYNIYVYPRRTDDITLYLDKITPLTGAPYFDYSSTEIRERLEFGLPTDGMLAKGVAEHIRTKRLWTPESLLERLNEDIENSPTAPSLLKRGKLHFHTSKWGEALNDFNRALSIEPQLIEAIQLKKMVEEILAYRYTDIYNA